MKTHTLKTLPVYFDAVERGDKTFELRNNDRDFQTGDTLILEEFDPNAMPPAEPFDYTKPPQLPSAPGMYSGRKLRAVVSYVLHDTWCKFGLERGFVVLGLAGVEPNVKAPSISDLP